MTHTIHSRTLDRTITFSRPGTAYAYLDLNGHSGTLGQQICEGGHLSGATVTYRGESNADFARLCQRWYRAYLRRLRT